MLQLNSNYSDNIGCDLKKKRKQHKIFNCLRKYDLVTNIFSFFFFLFISPCFNQKIASIDTGRNNFAHCSCIVGGV